MFHLRPGLLWLSNWCMLSGTKSFNVLFPPFKVRLPITNDIFSSYFYINNMICVCVCVCVCVYQFPNFVC